MDHPGAVQPGLPRANPTPSYWQDPPDEIADLRSSSEIPEDADIVIVGSGISGACIALNLLESRPNLKLVLLEARQAVSGASGRNGGHTKGASYRTFLDNVDLVGEGDAVKIARLEYACMVAVHDFIKKHDLPCDSRRLDTVDVFYDHTQWQLAQKSVALMRKLMDENDPTAKYTFWTPEEAYSRFRTPNSSGALTYEAGSLSAYKLTIGVLKLALQRDLNIQCNTPVTSIEDVSEYGTSTCWAVNTPRGSIRAAKLVLATNGYTATLYPALQGVIVPFRGIITAQRPGLAMPQTGLDTSYSFIYDTGYEYMISRPQGSKYQGDIVIGGGLTKTVNEGLQEYGQTDDTVLNEDITTYLTNITPTYFGTNWGKDQTEGRVRHAWSGIMGYSGDGHPLVGSIPGEKGLFIDASFQGHGMVLCFLCAKAVTKMILGEDEEELNEWFPDSFRITEERMKKRFSGSVEPPKAVEVTQNGF